MPRNILLRFRKNLLLVRRRESIRCYEENMLVMEVIARLATWGVPSDVGSEVVERIIQGQVKCRFQQISQPT